MRVRAKDSYTNPKRPGRGLLGVYNLEETCPVPKRQANRREQADVLFGRVKGRERGAPKGDWRYAGAVDRGAGEI